MGSRLLLMLVLLAIPAAADLGLFDQIHEKDAVTLVLPDGPCDAKVVKREPRQLTVGLKDTTRTCGKRKSLFMVSRSDVQDVVDRHSITPRPDSSGSGQCLGKLGLGVLLAGYGVASKTESEPRGLLVMAVGGIAL